MVLTVFAVLRKAPCRGLSSTTAAIERSRSPLATPPMTRPTSFNGTTRVPISELTESMARDHSPVAPASLARRVNLPSSPTAPATRSNSLESLPANSTTSLNVVAISPSRPVRSSGSRTEKSPFLNARRARRRADAANASPPEVPICFVRGALRLFVFVVIVLPSSKLAPIEWLT